MRTAKIGIGLIDVTKFTGIPCVSKETHYVATCMHSVVIDTLVVIIETYNITLKWLIVSKSMTVVTK